MTSEVDVVPTLLLNGTVVFLISILVPNSEDCKTLSWDLRLAMEVVFFLDSKCFVEDNVAKE